MQTGKFIKNAAVLTVTALILRGIGMVFRVWLSGAVGAEGMGLYQLILSVYMLAATFATSGICTAVTRLIAEELEVGTARSVRRILFRSVCLTLVIFSSTLLILQFSHEEPFAEYHRDGSNQFQLHYRNELLLQIVFRCHLHQLQLLLQDRVV